MQGIGVLLAVVGYAAAFTAYQQGFGPGGSFLYWLTGNPGLGQPTPTSSGGGGGQSAQQQFQQTGHAGSAGKPATIGGQLTGRGG